MPSRYAALTREQLAVLVPELLLTGHLIDRSGMAHCIAAFGADGMTEIAIEEWAAASPIYTRRMQRALGFEGTGVTTIFKGMQLEIGAPPQFMDFRYTVHDESHGEFHLDHCGALLDVEPMGEDYVRRMCHDIEDPTFDATAVATNPHAQVRPVHRPPRTPADRAPHCAWTVRVDPAAEPAAPTPLLAVNARTRAATLELDPIEASGDPAHGASDYAGPLVADVDFGAFSASALARIADEVVLQMHLLTLAFHAAVVERAADDEQGRHVLVQQLVGHAGLTAERLHRALAPGLDLGRGPEDAAQVLALHPVLNPAAYVALERDGATVRVARSAAHEDGGWLSLTGPHSPEPLRAIVRALDPRLDVELRGTEEAWSATVVRRDEPAREHPAVAVTRFSGGATFAFEPRTTLPLTVL